MKSISPQSPSIESYPRTLFLVAGILLGTSVLYEDVQAQEAGPGECPCKKTFEDVDSNKDGNISKDEFTARQETKKDCGCMANKGGKSCQHMMRNQPQFSEIDTDKNAKISEEEFLSFRKERMAEKAKNGRRMRNAKNAPTFSDLDSDKSGDLSEEEFKADQDKHMMRMRKTGAPEENKAPEAIE